MGRKSISKGDMKDVKKSIQTQTQDDENYMRSMIKDDPEVDTKMKNPSSAGKRGRPAGSKTKKNLSQTKNPIEGKSTAQKTILSKISKDSEINMIEFEDQLSLPINSRYSENEECKLERRGSILI
jgi:hypothetical protein